MSERQYEFRIDRKLDVTGDLTRAEEQVAAERNFQQTLHDFARDNLPSQEEYMKRAAAKYRARLAEYEAEQDMIQD